MEWFTSDSHFGDPRVLQRDHRPFENADQMDSYLIDTTNRLVKRTDTLYHLGDYASGSVERGIKLRNRIICNNVFLMYGNHDEKNRTFREFRRAFGKGHCHDILEIRREGRLLVMCHYPFFYPHHWDKGVINLSGHCHGEGMMHPFLPCIDVGVDIWNYRPINLTEVFKIVEEEIYKLPVRKRYKALTGDEPMKKEVPNG